MIDGFKDLPYNTRLSRIKLPTLVYRRIRGDMINVFKYLHSSYLVNQNFLIKANDTTTRWNTLKLVKVHNRTLRRQGCFSQRVVDWWNSLPETVVQAPSVNTFKNRFD